MELNIFLKLQDFLKTQGQRCMAIVPVIQKFAPSEMGETAKAEDKLDHDLFLCLEVFDLRYSPPNMPPYDPQGSPGNVE